MNNLKIIRKTSGLTLQQVADALGLSVSAISLYENENRSMNQDILQKFASLYNCKVDDIIRNSSEINLTNIIPLTPVKIVKPSGEMEQELIERFRSLDFDDKLKVFNYISNLKK